MTRKEARVLALRIKYVSYKEAVEILMNLKVRNKPVYRWDLEILMEHGK